MLSLLCVLAAITVVHCQPPAGVVTPVRDPEDYTLTFRDPLGCEVDECAYFAGIDINTGNPDYLDVYIEGDAQAWVALGFSDTASMFSADVLACNLDSGDVEVLDTWNLAAVQRDNVVDTVQDVFLFSGDFIDGRISCTFSRLISGSDVPMQDLDLSQDYFVLYGGNPNPGQAGRLVAHPTGPGNPSISATRVNAASLTVLGVAGPGEIPDTVIAPTRVPLDYRIMARTPAGCNPPSSCEVFVGIDTNSDPNFLDIYLEGDAEGWVAVGFSDSPNMFSADVLACDINPVTEMVEVIDSWNEGSPTRNNLRDPTPNTGDTGMFSSSFENGRITCTFPRRILGTNIGVEDLDLNEPYFILYGRSPNSGSPGQLEAHEFGAGNPFVSSSRVNPQTDTNPFVSSSRVNPQTDTSSHAYLSVAGWFQVMLCISYATFLGF